MPEQASYVIVGIVAVVVIVAIVYRACVNSKVKRTSKRLEYLKQINGRYSTQFQLIEPTENLRYSLNSKSQFDRFNFETRFNEAIAERPEEFKSRLATASQNQRHWNRYQSEINGLPKTQYDAKRYVKAEARLMKKNSLQQPVINPQVKLDWSYTSPKGRNHYAASSTFNASDIESALQVAKSKTTRQAQISAERAAMTDKLRYQVMERDNFRCVLCGSSANDGVKLHVDHIYPVSKGGKTEMSNLRTLCDRCNMGKGAHVEKATNQ